MAELLDVFSMKLGWSVIVPAPTPVAVGVKIPMLVSTIVTDSGSLATPLQITRTSTTPSGVLDGMIALIWPALTTKGMALTVTLPCVTVISTSPTFVSRGNPAVKTATVGPISTPKIENIEPRAISPPGKLAARKWAPLTMPPAPMTGTPLAWSGVVEIDMSNSNAGASPPAVFANLLRFMSSSCRLRISRRVRPAFR